MSAPGMAAGPLFPGFEQVTVVVDDQVQINAVIGGNDPPLLLLHGHPQTHAIWHKVAPALAESFTVVASDLRGYGDSSKPDGDGEHLNYSKRAMALDQVALMRDLGFSRFELLAHDRGARVALTQTPLPRGRVLGPFTSPDEADDVQVPGSITGIPTWRNRACPARWLQGQAC